MIPYAPIRMIGGMTTTETPTELDPAAVGEFAGRIFGAYGQGMLAFMVDLGHRTGLFDAAVRGPATSQELADRAGLHERYVREWLGAVVTGGIFEYDAKNSVYTLPAVAAACLTGPGANNVAPFSGFIAHMGTHLQDVARAFKEGGGVPYSAFRPGFTDIMDAGSRHVFDGTLIDLVLPMAPGLVDSLAAGARVADIGCGTGHALVLMAKAFPDSTFVGYDLATDAIEKARAEADAEGLTNVTFEVHDIAKITPAQPFDAITTFDTIHDLVDPVGVLAAVYANLRPGGTYLMVEPHLQTKLEDNIGHPMAPMLYATSTLHCLTVSLAEGGAGLGTCFGEQKALELLADAGFGEVAVLAHPADPIDGIFITHRPEEA
jgi:2-polyprenyl-3-methyl-5-hydroxy-6-metoxy-1,4-benzoquinol methylase